MAHPHTKEKLDNHGGLVDLKVTKGKDGLFYATMPEVAALRMGFSPSARVIVLQSPKATDTSLKPKQREKFQLVSGTWACTPLRAGEGDAVRTRVQAVERLCA